ncbi:hypothetical protein DSO57_1014176 [Entomophthora muscae]|uniref:Uncharacterized protein n=2 Tax=Entomophthora muscae TaxID=34485 RepID=A0ACC2T4D9_9FUNG|nr:hypothetical protein DSO57_1019483 [Entomophthora muscae]KAJ9077713.1 hypothetical protein DSO57_1014176 [Entomophthora muscae]
MFRLEWVIRFALFLAAGVWGDNTLAEIITINLNAPQGFAKLQELIDDLGERRRRGQVGQSQVPLKPPRVNYGFTGEELDDFLYHSLISGCTQEMVDTQLCYCKGKFEEATIFDDSEIEARTAVAVDLTHKLIVVSYRLTVGLKNWETNADRELVSYPFPGGEEKVHRGHLKWYLALKKPTERKVIELFNTSRYQNFTLHVTGYSLGGSVTAISMPAWLSLLEAQGLKNKARFFDYSGPRPGNVAFAKYLETLDAPLVRYAKKGDVVPHLPDQYMGYSQVGQEYYDSELTPFVRSQLKQCSPNFVQDSNCGMKDTEFAIANHFFPFNRPMPTPPFCYHS